MALIRVAQYNSTPTVVGDYQAQNAHLQAFTNQLMTQQFILDSGTAQPVIKQGCYVSHGGSLYIADADTSITGSPADGSVYIRVSGTTSLTVEFVTNISGYTWNPVYSALTSGSYTLLPYLIVKAGTVWTRYNFNPNNQQFGNLGAVTCTSVDTGQGTTEVYLMNQNLRTTDSPTFASLHVDTAYLSKFANLSAGAIAPPYNSVFNLSSSSTTSYTSVASFSLASSIVKSVDLSSNGVTGCRLAFLKLGAAGAVATQVRILVDGVQVYESAMSFVSVGEAISFDVSCTPGQTIDIQKRCASNAPSEGTTGSISVSRTYTNAEKINEYLYNQIA